MKDANNQSLMSILAPPASPEALARFLNVTGHVVGCRTDADLARLMGVPATALANWKRRGKVSEQGIAWFQSNLIPALVTVSPNMPQLIDTTANAALIDLLVSTSGDPLRCGEDARFANALALPGLSALSILIVELLRIQAPGRGGSDDDAVVDVLKEAVEIFRKSPVFERFTA